MKAVDCAVIAPPPWPHATRRLVLRGGLRRVVPSGGDDLLFVWSGVVVASTKVAKPRALSPAASSMGSLDEAAGLSARVIEVLRRLAEDTERILHLERAYNHTWISGSAFSK